MCVERKQSGADIGPEVQAAAAAELPVLESARLQRVGGVHVQRPGAGLSLQLVVLERPMEPQVCVCMSFPWEARLCVRLAWGSRLPLGIGTVVITNGQRLRDSSGPE